MVEAIPILRDISACCVRERELSSQQLPRLGEPLERILSRESDSLDQAVGLCFPRGGVSWWMEDALHRRDAALREFAARFLEASSISAQAREIRKKSIRYAASAWRFDRKRADIPTAYRNTEIEFLWCAFKSGAAMPIGERQLRIVLAGNKTQLEPRRRREFGDLHPPAGNGRCSPCSPDSNVSSPEGRRSPTHQTGPKIERSSSSRRDQKLVTLAFVGDLMLGRRINEAIAQRDPDWFWGDVLPLLQSADAVIANLECPITEHGESWDRSWKSFRFRADPAAVDVLKAANIRFVNLANNHILDFQARGLLDTLDHLEAAGIAYGGAGRNMRDAIKPAVLSVSGLHVGFIALTDNMPLFSARVDRAGTNFVRIRNNHTTLSLMHLLIKDLRQAGADLVAMSAHWGPNLRPWPPRYFRRFARQAVDMGVDVLHGHSAHIFQGVELRGRAPIFYDTGDFLDDYWVFPGIRTDRSFVFFVDVVGKRIRRIRLVPVSLESGKVRRARDAEFEAICCRMARLCRPFRTPISFTAEGIEILVSQADRYNLGLASEGAATPYPAAGSGRGVRSEK